MFVDKGFTKENLDYYLKELVKEFRKGNGKDTSAEIVLVGGAAILANYGFREMTYDMDAVITASSAMKEAVNTVGDRFGLPNGWLNAYEGEKVKESNVDEIIQKALRKKRDNRDAR